MQETSKLSALQGISNIGWIVIGIIALTIIVGVIIIALRRGFSYDIDDKVLAVGKINQKIDDKIEKSREIEHKDKDLQNLLHGKAEIIDKKITADLKRIIRNLDKPVSEIFSQYMKCEFPFGEPYRIISTELFQRLEDNNIREKYSLSESKGYVQDIMRNIKAKYENFLRQLSVSPCKESYPKWSVVEPEIEIIINSWILDSRAILCERIYEKILMYKEYKLQFQLEDYKNSACVKPMYKNEQYLAKMGVRI